MKDYRIFVLLCLLYYLQGIPYGIQMKILPIYFYDILRYPINFVTRISLLMSPWIFLKPLVAFFVKSHKVSFFCINLSLLGSGLLHVVLYLIMPYENNLSLVPSWIVLILINCTTVLLDASTDRLAITSAASFQDLKFLGISNSIQIIAYKCGATFGGIAMHVLGYEKIHFMFLTVGAVYIAAVGVLPLFWPHLDSRASEESQAGSTKFWFYHIYEVFSVKCTIPLICFALVYKLGEAGASVLYPVFLLQSGVSRNQVSFFTSFISEPMSLAGSLCGGILCSMQKSSTPILFLLKLLAGFGLLRVMPLYLQTHTDSSAGIVVSLGSMSFLGGIVSTLTFTLMMVVSSQACDRLKATHYAVISSIEVCGKLLFSSYAGDLSLYLGRLHVYFLFILLTFFASLPLYLIRKRWSGVKLIKKT